MNPVRDIKNKEGRKGFETTSHQSNITMESKS
jgi:hypothetical protein